MPQAVAVLSGSLRIRLTQPQLERLLKQWQAEGKPGDRMTFQLVKS